MLAYDGSTRSTVWRDVELGMLVAAVRDALLGSVVLTGQRLDFSWLGAKADTQIQLPLMTGAQIVSRLAALTGAARLSYAHLKETSPPSRRCGTRRRPSP